MQGLTVQGVSPTRLTPRPNENIEVPDEVGRTIVARNLARRLTESRIAIVTGGLGVQPEALTVAGLVRALIMRAGLVRVAVSLQSRGSLTLKPERLSDYATRVRERIKADHALPAGMHRIEGVSGADVGKSTGGVYFVDDEVELEAEVEL